MISNSILPDSKFILSELGIEASSVRFIKHSLKRTHYQAAINWLSRYIPKSTENKLEQIRGFLEAFHHFCSVDALQPASRILTIRLNTVTHDEFDYHLYIWGYCQEQIKLYEALLGKLDATCDSIFLNGLGLAYRSLGDYTKAANYYFQSVTIAKALHDLEGEGIALCNSGHIHILQGQCELAIACFQDALQIAYQSKDIPLLADTIGNLGLVFQTLGEYAKAIECHQQYLAIAQRIDDPTREHRALNGLGIAYQRLGNYTQAVDVYQQSLAISRKIGHRFDEGTVLGNLGAAFLELGDYQKAIDYFQQHQVLAEEISDRAGIARAAGNLSITYERLGNYIQARDFAQKHCQIATEIGDRSGEAKALHELGLALIKLDRFTDAKEQLQGATSLLSYIGNADEQAEVLKDLAYLHYQLGDCEAALTCCQTALAISNQSGGELWDACHQLIEQLQSENENFIA